MRSLRFALVCVALTATLSFFNSTAMADGCWGSSRGGFSSFGGGSLGGASQGSGSWGCRGGLFSNAPVRSLLSRVGDGIANVLDRKPLRTALFGGCWGGGSGGFGCSGGGGCWGGNGYSSTGSSVGSWNSPGFVGPSYGSGCVGSMAISSPLVSSPIIASSPLASQWDTGSSFAANELGIPMSDGISAYQGPIAVNQYETSAPVLDYGYTGSQIGILGVPTDASMINGNVVTGSMLEATSGTPNYAPNTYYGTPGLDTPPSSIANPPGDDEDVGAIEEEDDSAMLNRRRSGTAILTLDVPESAKVYVNDRLTNTRGTRRSYASHNLAPDEEYRYRVRVVSQVEGKEVVKNDTIVMRANDRELLAFDFKPVVTRLVVKVPEDAKVTIDGSDTDATGTYRSFSTRKLTSGKWDDYSVEVSVVRDGKTLTQKRKFDLVAGQFRFLPFDFDGKTDVATK